MDLNIVISSFDLFLSFFKCSLDLDLVIVESSIKIFNVINRWRCAHYNVLSHDIYFVDHLGSHWVYILFTISFFELRNWLILRIIGWHAKVSFGLRLVLIRFISWILTWTTKFLMYCRNSSTCCRCYTTTKCLGPIKYTSTLSRLILIKYALVHVWSSLWVGYASLNITKFGWICLHHWVQKFH